MKLTVKNLILMCGLLAVLPMTSCSDNEPDNTVTVNLVNTKLTYNGDGEWADALNTEVHGIDCQGVTFSHTATASEWAYTGRDFARRASQTLMTTPLKTHGSTISMPQCRAAVSQAWAHRIL